MISLNLAWQKSHFSSRSGAWGGEVVAGSAGEEIGFAFAMALSDGQYEISRVQHSVGKNGQLIETGRESWKVPEGIATDGMVFLSIGAPTDRLLAKLENCFQVEQSGATATPGLFAQRITLQGIVALEPPAVAISKMFLSRADGDERKPEAYAEFFFGINALTAKAWLSPKDPSYSGPILEWLKNGCDMR